MCDTCGCSADEEHSDSGVRISPVQGHGSEGQPSESHVHPHPHGQGHEVGHDHSSGFHAGVYRGQGLLASMLKTSSRDERARSVKVQSDVMEKNDQLALANRRWFQERTVLTLNLVSSPGAGKTALLERTLRDLASAWPWAVIEGDQQTDNDARRIAACGAPVVQINTGAVCHLDAHMVRTACRSLDPPSGAVLMIENVGNLVCPALFDLGEAEKVVIASVTEGEDKPAKYPYMFQAAGLVILNKIDLLPYVQFDTEKFEQLVHHINPRAQVLAVSATRGDNLPAWYDWLRVHRAIGSAQSAHSVGAAD
jgi:hydrogenase nickel incorporation protein HypB